MLKGWVFGYMTRIYSYYLVVSGNGSVGISGMLLFPLSHHFFFQYEKLEVCMLDIDTSSKPLLLGPTPIVEYHKDLFWLP